MANRFYMICTRDTVGSNASFWCQNGHGYNTSLDKAHVYTLAEAQSHWNTGRNIDQPVCANRVDALAVVHVDHQHVPGESVIESDCRQYVAFQKWRWDGNDLYWLRNGDLPTTDFTKATIFDKPGDTADLVWLPFTTADAVKRRTFPIAMLDHRRMVQGAGLRVPAHIQRARRRKPGTGKTRFNCPNCGRIHWQLNPYDFEGCADWQCEGARKHG
ncbi:hypothetical protein RM150_22300 (plasmid) [Pantoea agglomerans]|uniref:hypothetical protein n=1 Tax=Enterobacter agglomerans TaxID=549 RepID=UPI002898303A|nr:hypothetical protein [Pantoea agglomerans]WNK46989.1 hypothetical protein RM150_22300 [Pantoea agglomerans]